MTAHAHDSRDVKVAAPITPIDWQRSTAGSARSFPLPHGVIEAERLRLSPEPGDASLIRDLRANATHDAHYIAELESKLVAAAPPMRDVLTITDPHMRFAEVGAVVKALCAAGHTVRFASSFDSYGAFILTLSVVEKAA